MKVVSHLDSLEQLESSFCGILLTRATQSFSILCTDFMEVTIFPSEQRVILTAHYWQKPLEHIHDHDTEGCRHSLGAEGAHGARFPHCEEDACRIRKSRVQRVLSTSDHLLARNVPQSQPLTEEVLIMQIPHCGSTAQFQPSLLNSNTSHL